MGIQMIRDKKEGMVSKINQNTCGNIYKFLWKENYKD